MGELTLEEMFVEDGGEPESPWPEYKKDAPPDRGLIVSDGAKGCLIDHIGPAISYWQDEIGDPESWDGYPAGVWIWEGRMKTWKTWTDYGYEHDCSLIGEERALTTEEWEDFQSHGQGPWNSDDWISKYPGPDDESEDDQEAF